MPKSVKKLTKMENHSSDDEEDALEMERNFALLSKRSTMQASAENEEKIRDEEDDEAPEEDEDGSAEVGDNGIDDEGDSGSDEGDTESEDDESVSDHEDGGSNKAQTQRKGSFKSGRKKQQFCHLNDYMLTLVKRAIFTFTLISFCLYRIINHVI